LQAVAMPKFVVSSLIFILVMVAIFVMYRRKTAPEKVSCFGEYRGYSEAEFDGGKRISDYLTLADGTRLAHDLILLTKRGVPADTSLPVLFKYTPYGRAWNSLR
jgi:hypothetical protein